MTETDLSNWLVGMEAAMRIGCSTRTIERLAAAQKLEQRLRPQAGSPAVAVYNPDDVSRLAAERRPAPAPFVLGAVTAPGNGNGTGHDLVEQKKLHRGSFPVPAGEDLIRGLALLLSKALQSPPSSPVAATVAETFFLTVREAAAVSGLTETNLRRRIAAGTLPAEKDRGWKIRRRDLEAL